MLLVIVSWLYIGFICLVFGHAFFHLPLVKKHVGALQRGSVHFIMAGVVIITVFSGYFSLVHKIGTLFHIILLLALLVLTWRFRKAILSHIKALSKAVLSWEGLLYCGIIVFLAFFASRGEFHFDTNIYHAQMIRWLEEVGVVPGLGNLQRQYAYNSSYLSFAAVFGMKWLLGISLHTTTGFLAAVLTIYALRGLKGVLQRKNHVADLCRLAMLLYVFHTLFYLMSPSTDYGALMVVAYLLLRWAEVFEQKGAVDEYALLCVLAVFAMTLKLSAATMVLLFIYPAFCLLRARQWQRILFFVALGLLVLVPWLLANFMLSGWLFYPFMGMDIFTVDWKMPLDALQRDNADIVAGARNINKAELYLGFREWLPLWWEQTETFHRMLLYANVIALGLFAFIRCAKIYLGKKIQPPDGPLLVAYFAVISSVLLWFVMAPFVRYGLIFLLLLPALAIGESLSLRHNGCTRVVSGLMIVLIFFSLSAYWDSNTVATGMFIKKHISAPHYIMAQDYDRFEADTVTISGQDFYVPKDNFFVGYYNFPGSISVGRPVRCEMRGTALRQGFRPLY